MSADLPFAAGFPEASEADWLAAVRGVLLKGRSDATDDDFAAAFERQLVSSTADGLAIQPLYTSGPTPDAATRGWRTGPWEIRQPVGTEGALTELENGATGLLVDVATADQLAAALDGVHLHMVPVSLAGGGLAADLLALWDARATPLDQRAGTFGLDPIGAWARAGGASDLAAATATAGDVLARLSDHPPAVRALVADGTVWHEAGATPAQELAWSIAVGRHYLQTYGPAAAGRIELRWATDADQFTGIAKLRAARQLWQRATDGGPRAYHHAVASRAMLTRYDTWTNALRSTVACFAAGVGGADAVTVWPHDLLVTPGGSPLGRRIARNTQTILQSESNLWRVADMAGGSWYVETLTDQLAAAAWAELARVESLGGIVAAIEQGALHAALDDVLAARAARLATRRQPLTGLSEFPDIGEEPPPLVPEPAIARLTEPPFPPFGLVRLAQEFERQRGRADMAWRRTGERPVVYLATLGTAAQFTARATFAKNLFEAAGIRTITGPVTEFAASGARVACLCSADPVYAEQGAAAAADLRSAGATRVYVAGRKLDLPGVDEEVGVGSDVLDVLTRALDALGVQ